MSTIASPRPSISLSSRRTSTSTDTISRPSTLNTRKHRAALRDYYNLAAAGNVENDSHSDAHTGTTLEHDHELESELDKPDFDPTAYVTSVLATEGLEGILRVEARLVGQIRSLDGEKKALVYDNYSKLIAATETTRKMRMNMDPLAAETGGLMETVERIAGTAGELAEELRRQHARSEDVERRKRMGQQEVVRAVLNAPERLEVLCKEGKRGEAEAEWRRVEAILDGWKKVKGVEEVRKACETALKMDED